MIFETLAVTLLVLFGHHIGASNEKRAAKHEIACNQACPAPCHRVLLLKNKDKGESYFACQGEDFWVK